MSGKDLVREGLILLTCAAIAGLLFWMALYLLGPFALIPGAVILFAMLARFHPSWAFPRGFVERAVFACLLAAQGSLLTAVIVEALPHLVSNLV